MGNKQAPPVKGAGGVPKLRFPEFKDAGEWEEKKLGEVCGYENGKAHENHVADVGKYVVVNSKFISTEGETRKYSDNGFCLARKEDVLMVLSDVPNGRAIAKCYFVEEDNLYTVNQRICVIRPNNTVGRFLFYFLDRNLFYLAFDDGVKQTNLRKDDVISCPIPLPSLPEQQKIADCLSSLDDLISAETKKLETLKIHKKGLMQQLFPAEGESVPKLRFPEFKDAGEWEEKKLGEVSTFINQKVSLEEVTLFNYISTENILPDYCGVVMASKLPSLSSVIRFIKDDILISNIRPYLKKVWLADKNGGASNDVIVIRSKTNLYNQYLAFLLKNDEFISYVMKGAKGVKMPRGDISLMREYPILLPTLPEQQKIADCLSSLDDLISAETKKLETLKIHKKGLMQQLFPAAEEVGG